MLSTQKITNLPLIIPRIWANFLAEEIKHGATCGPFTTPPIPDLHISPLMSRPKANTNKRMYLNTPFILTLPTVDDIKTTILAKGKGCHLAKVDISRAYGN